METIQHFSHPEHPLTLKSLGEEDLGPYWCDFCGKRIKEKDNYYACENGDRLFHLHKKCADLPREIILPIHQHPLTFFPSNPYENNKTFSCNICQGKLYGSTYHCSICDFDIDVKCSSLLLKGNNILQHQGHPHPLTLNLRPSLFHCDACDTKDEDRSYFCSTCNFWIHKSCASLPQSIEVAHHEDPLLLTCSLPPEYLRYQQYCRICFERVYPSKWAYYCDKCRYFNHLKCINRASNYPNFPTADYSDLMQFPLSNHDSQDPTSLFVNDKNTSGAYDSGATEIHHRLHDHPLSLHNDALITTNNMEACNDILCDGCVRPISVPFYSCSKCNFFLHRFCAELAELQCPLEELECPLEFHKPGDPEYSIEVDKSHLSYQCFECTTCLQYCNGYRFSCKSCCSQFDIGCAFSLFPFRIKHNSHKHPLGMSYSLPRVERIECNACGLLLGEWGRIRAYSYGCQTESHCRFYVCIRCANYQGSAQHEYDIHSIPLTYFPIKDHPSDYICEICEKDINPWHWKYHCQDCNQSFHTHCLSPVDRYSNVKFGGTFDIIEDIHQHPLTFVRNSHSKYALQCGRCASDINGVPILECAPCGFKLCKRCFPPCAFKY